MFRIESKNTNNKVVPMSKMEPYGIGKIVSPGNQCGHIVMRTASINKFEVMDLTDQRQDGSCWTYKDIQLEVELFPPGASICFTIIRPGI